MTPARPSRSPPVTLVEPQNGRGLPPLESMPPEQVARAIQAVTNRLIAEVSKVVVGKQEVLELVTVNLLAGGNVLFEDYPGLAKSLLSETFSRASGCHYKRIQFTPDLLPSDIVGSNVFNQKTAEFSFRAGPVFTNFLLADEINRAPPKTQAALLETMQERQVTVEGVTRKLEAPYIVMATQNPVEQEGTYPLPEAQTDRFLVKLAMGYPSEEDEVGILERRVQRAQDAAEVQAVTHPAEILWMQRGLERIHVDPVLMRYIVKLVQATRKHPSVLVGSSPRGSLGLLKLARAHAALRGRPFATPDDIKRVAVPCLAHRILLKPEPRIRGERGEDVVQALLRTVPAPVLRPAA
jgi:MoxR-like ATPase